MMDAVLVLEQKKSVKIEKVDIPHPKYNEVLIKMHACGCCHTDVDIIDGNWPQKSKLPLVLGHEGVGHVVGVGSSVTHLSVGDRVGISWLASACGVCEFCVTGWETLCNCQRNSGFSVDGVMREYATAEARYCIPIPDSVSYVEAAPILCAGVTSYKALKESELKPGEYVAIIGAAGGLGHLAVQYAKAMGMIPIAIDVGQDKLDFCSSLGVEHVFEASSPDLKSSIMNLTGGGCHGVMCLATHPSAFESGIALCRRKGTFVMVGLPKGGFEMPIFDVVLNRITVRGSIIGNREDMKEALRFVERGLVKCSVKEESFHNAEEVFNALREGKVEGRVVLTMGD